ncbi:hypothetical protein [Archangium lipolyticum]|uniref:hypothetical protein n=1 Tax=Archangium lipolyticum TaxID=2970465 RepID=UPI002149A0E7|nr:hypothetical protein [Archangium lipolyticum]
MKMKSMRKGAAALTAAATLLPAAPSLAQEAPKLQIGGTTYTKWLYGSSREQGSLYNYTTIPGESAGDNGIGTELELLLNAKLSSAVEVRGRIHSRFSQNFWTNGGGWGKTDNNCTSGNCGEFDNRSSQYIKLRGMAVTLTPGYLIDSATIGANDFGQFDPLVVGRIRYIDRDNVYGVLVQGSALERKLTWDVAGISLPRLWAGPRFSTGAFHATDATYVAQSKYTFNDMFDLGAIFQYTNDSEVNPTDVNYDDGRDLMPRFRNGVGGLKAGFHLDSKVDVKGAFYRSYSNVDADPAKGLIDRFSPIPGGRLMDNTMMLDVSFNDPLDIGLSLNMQAFSIGANYVSVMASRRESDVLLTEGHDGAFGGPGPANDRSGQWGDPNYIGYGGWTGETQQVATVNVDNEFTDFDEPFAETVIGWKGATFNPVFSAGALELAGEYSYITYNTNWQAYGDDSKPIDNRYPMMDGDVGVGHGYRSAYQPFQDKLSHILVAKGRYVLDIGRGIDVFGKVKYIYENDKRMNNAKYLPYQAGACAGQQADGSFAACDNTKINEYSPGNSTSTLYSNPHVVTVDGQQGYAFKPFDDISDDDRELKYTTFSLGTGYQLTDDLYMSLSYAKYLADLKDGTTAFRAYGSHQMASGKHDKNQLSLRAKYILAGVEFGAEAGYAFGTFNPEYGSGFLPQRASADIASKRHIPADSLGFNTNQEHGDWFNLEDRKFQQMRLKVFMKAQF